MSFFLRILLFIAPSYSLLYSVPSTSPRPMVEMEGMPDSFYQGCVNVISGGYCDHEVDISIPGPFPIQLERVYSSSATFQLADKFIGWSQPLKLEMLYNWRMRIWHDREYESADLLGVYCSESSGTALYYDWWTEKKGKQKVTLVAKPETFYKGFTNCGAGLISGRNHLKNNVLKFGDKHAHCYLTTGSGEQRFYNSNNLGAYLLQYLRKPDGNTMRWSYNREFPIRCWTCNASGTHEYAALNYFENHDQKFVNTSDGRQRVASYISLKDFEHGGEWWYLTEVVRSDKPTVSYEYDKSYEHKGACPLIQKIYPEQRRLKIGYYKEGVNHVHGEQIRLSYKSKEINRVLSLHAPVGKDASLIPVGSFIYNSIPEGMQTRVWDALDNQTNYIVDHNDRLKKISYYEKTEGVQKCKREDYFNWSADGSLLSTEYFDGGTSPLKRIDYTYDGKGNVISKTLKGVLTGRTESLESVTHSYSYSGQMNLLVSETDPSGLVTTFSYYPGTDLIQSKLVKSHEEIIQREFLRYNEDAVLIERINDDGSASFVDDLTDVTMRKIVKVTPRMEKPCWGFPAVEEEFYWEEGQEKLFKRTEKEYDLGGRVISEKVYGADGVFAYSKTWEYDAHGNCLLEIDALGQEVRRTYDANGNMLMEEGPRPSVRTVYQYDYANRLIEKRAEGLGELYVQQYGYNYLGQKVSEIDHFGNETRFVCDRFGNCLKKISPPLFNKNPGGSLEALELKESWIYNSLGQMVAATDTQGLVTKFSYNVKGDKTRVQYPDGTCEWFYYTPDGRLEEEWTRTGIGKRYGYDAQGRKVKEELLDRNQKVAATTSYVYVRGHLKKVIDALGNTTLYSYDGAGRLVREQRIDKEGVCIADAKREFDALGRVCKEIQGEGESATVTVVERDFLDRIIEQRVETLSGKIQQLVRTSYDEVGNPTEVFKEGVHCTTTTYDLKNRPILMVDPLEGETRIFYDEEHVNESNQKVLKKETYDPLGQLQVVIHNSRGEPVCVQTITAEGEVCGIQEITYRSDQSPKTILQRVYSKGEEIRDELNEWHYDTFGRVCALIEGKGSAEETITSKSYTRYGEFLDVVRPDGTILTHVYDSLGRMDAMSSSDGSISYRYHYDAVGNLVEMEDCIKEASTKRTYDALKRIVKEELQHGFVVLRTFDLQGRAVKTTYSNGKEVSYTYQGSELKEVNAKGKSSYQALYQSYNLSGQLMCYQGVGKSGAELYAYDTLGRFVSQSGPHFSEEVKGYDLSGNIQGIITKDPYGKRVVDYEYGVKYQLTREGLEHAYQYDSLSNRLEKDGHQEKVNSLNQVLEAGSTSCDYDKNGNLVRLSKENEEWTFSYDALDRLTGAFGENLDDQITFEISYAYDGFNRCIERAVEIDLCYSDSEVGRSVERDRVIYLYDGIREVGSCDKKGATCEFRFLSPSGKAIALELFKEAYAPVYNFRGDLVVLVNPKTGKSVGTTRYSAFGEESGSTLSPWRFQNKRVDALTGFCNFGRRWYAPSLARWITRDPLSYAAGPNLYAYVDNRPLIFVDVQGLYAQQLHTSNNCSRRGFELNGAIRMCWEASCTTGKYINKMLAPLRETSGMYVVPGRELKNTRMGYVNGVDNSLSDSMASAEMISQSMGGARVDVCYFASRTILVDLAKCDAQRARTMSGNRYIIKESYILAQHLVQACAELDAEGGGIYKLFVHSGGAFIADNAASLLSNDIRQRVDIYVFGGGTVIPIGTFRNANNYHHYGDPVGSQARLCFRGKCRQASLPPDKTANIEMVGNPHSFYNLSCHSFNHEDYQDALIRIGKDFAREGLIR